MRLVNGSWNYWRNATGFEPAAGSASKIEDDQSQKTYLLIPQENFRQWVDAELRRELQIGFDEAEADAGEVAEWDVESILSTARSSPLAEGH